LDPLDAKVGDSGVLTITNPRFGADFGCDRGIQYTLQSQIPFFSLGPASPAFRRLLCNFGLRFGSGQIVVEFCGMPFLIEGF